MFGKTAARYQSTPCHVSIWASGCRVCECGVDADLIVDCFTAVEFLPQDYAVMSYYVNNSPQSWLTTTVVAVKMLLDHEQREDCKRF